MGILTFFTKVYIQYTVIQVPITKLYLGKYIGQKITLKIDPK